ncbi:MAG: MoaD/ThiS family protein [Candidatus Nanopelagicales bacterium]
MVTIRFFAAAREAAGRASVEVPAGAVGERLTGLALGPRFDDVLAVSTLLCDGQHLALEEEVGEGAVVDVLPPFAGG